MNGRQVHRVVLEKSAAFMLRFYISSFQVMERLSLLFRTVLIVYYSIIQLNNIPFYSILREFHNRTVGGGKMQ